MASNWIFTSKIKKKFFEILIAPDYDSDALEFLKNQTGAILLKYPPQKIAGKKTAAVTKKTKSFLFLDKKLFWSKKKIS